MNTTKCRCDGMNEECIFCGGSGFLTEERVEIIKTIVDKSKLRKENKELDNYLHPNLEKDKDKRFKIAKVLKKGSLKRIKPKKKTKAAKKKRSKKKTITVKELTKSEPLKYIGPNNPNRKTNTHSKRRKQGKRN